MDLHVAPRQKLSRSVSTCVHPPSFPPSITTTTTRHPPLPYSLTESQVDRVVHCIHCFCPCSVWSSLGSNEGHPFLHRLSPVIPQQIWPDFKSFRNQLFLTHSQSFPPGTLPQCRQYWSKGVLVEAVALSPKSVFAQPIKALALKQGHQYTRLPLANCNYPHWPPGSHLASTRAFEAHQPILTTLNLKVEESKLDADRPGEDCETPSIHRARAWS